MNINNEIISAIFTELDRAENKHPKFPFDKIYQAAILQEECGELVRACVQFELENGNLDEIKIEAIHTAAMAIRILKNL